MSGARRLRMAAVGGFLVLASLVACNDRAADATKSDSSATTSASPSSTTEEQAQIEQLRGEHEEMQREHAQIEERGSANGSADPGQAGCSASASGQSGCGSMRDQVTMGSGGAAKMESEDAANPDKGPMKMGDDMDGHM